MTTPIYEKSDNFYSLDVNEKKIKSKVEDKIEKTVKDQINSEEINKTNVDKKIVFSESQDDLVLEKTKNVCKLNLSGSFDFSFGDSLADIDLNSSSLFLNLNKFEKVKKLIVSIDEEASSDKEIDIDEICEQLFSMDNEEIREFVNDNNILKKIFYSDVFSFKRDDIFSFLESKLNLDEIFKLFDPQSGGIALSYAILKSPAEDSSLFFDQAKRIFGVDELMSRFRQEKLSWQGDLNTETVACTILVLLSEETVNLEERILTVDAILDGLINVQEGQGKVEVIDNVLKILFENPKGIKPDSLLATLNWVEKCVGKEEMAKQLHANKNRGICSLLKDQLSLQSAPETLLWLQERLGHEAFIQILKKIPIQASGIEALIKVLENIIKTPENLNLSISDKLEIVAHLIPSSHLNSDTLILWLINNFNPILSGVPWLDKKVLEVIKKQAENYVSGVISAYPMIINSVIKSFLNIRDIENDKEYDFLKKIINSSIVLHDPELRFKIISRVNVLFTEKSNLSNIKKTIQLHKKTNVNDYFFILTMFAFKHFNDPELSQILSSIKENTVHLQDPTRGVKAIISLLEQLSTMTLNKKDVVNLCSLALDSKNISEVEAMVVLLKLNKDDKKILSLKEMAEDHLKSKFDIHEKNAQLKKIKKEINSKKQEMPAFKILKNMSKTATNNEKKIQQEKINDEWSIFINENIYYKNIKEKSLELEMEIKKITLQNESGAFKLSNLLDNVVKEYIGDAVSQEKVRALSSKFRERFPGALGFYLSRVLCLKDPQKKQDLLYNFARYIENSNDRESWQKERYDLAKNSHLRKLETIHKGIIEKWKKLAIEDGGDLLKIKDVKGNILRLTDNPVDLLLLGSEFSDSCQDIRGKIEENRGLIGSVLNGQSLTLGHQVEGSRVWKARAMLRLAILPSQGESPERVVLVFGDIYPGAASKEQKEQIKAAAQAVAKDLNIQLVSATSIGDKKPDLTVQFERCVPEYLDGLKVKDNWPINLECWQLSEEDTLG